ncbi:hypothetical protein Bbelb_115760 [Branchiostoma belcheri]|nr:hypothetical protein Bbelb_115760 [Branchiostoma belcheri]
MSFKPDKLEACLLRWGKVRNQVFSVNNQNIPTIQREPVKSLRRLYTSDIDDSKRRFHYWQLQIEGKTATLWEENNWVPIKAALAGRNKLTLSTAYVTEEYKLDKARMALELIWPKDNAVKKAYRRQKTGR